MSQRKNAHLNNLNNIISNKQLEKLEEIATNTASSGSGDASAANQTTQIGHLSTIEGDTTSLDGKISKGNDGTLNTVQQVGVYGYNLTSTSFVPLETDSTSKLKIVDDKITVGSDDSIPAATGAQQNLIYGRNDGTGNLHAIKCGTDGNLHVFDADITSGNDATLSSAQQVLIYGRDSTGGVDAINVDNQGHLKITIDTVENKGSQGNIQNGTLAFGSSSSSVDVSDFNHSNILYEDTNTSSFDDPVLEVSVDNTNFYKSFTSISPVVRGSKREAVIDIKLHGIKYIRIKNESTADNFTSCVCSVVGTPN